MSYEAVVGSSGCRAARASEEVLVGNKGLVRHKTQLLQQRDQFVTVSSPREKYRKGTNVTSEIALGGLHNGY